MSQLFQRRNAAAVALDSDNRSTGLQQSAGQSARTRAHFVDALSVQIAWDRGNPSEQLPIEDEILPERLARA